MPINQDEFDQEDDRLESTWDRWQRLPLPYRVNAFLYVLGFLSLVILLAQVISDSGDKPRQVEVASRAPSTTRPRPATTTSNAPPSTVTTVAPPSSTSSTVAATRSTGGTGGTGSSGGGSSRVSPPDTEPIPGLDTLGCLNSTESRCGAFSWDPPAGNNLPIVINVERNPSVAQVGEPVTFTIVVTDGDHLVSDNCAVLDFGDGVVVQAPCQSVGCPETFGPWNPPARQAGSATFTYSHAYTAPGSYSPTFEFHSDRDRCPDPYGNFGRGRTTVTIDPAP